MYKLAIAIMLVLWAGGALAATPAKAAKAAKPARPPSLEKLACRTGPNDEQARLIVEAVKGRVMEFAFYSRLGTLVCSIHSRRGDAHTQWEDNDAKSGHAAVKLQTGSAHVEYAPGHALVKFMQVERMPYCGMYGELNGSIEVAISKTECTLSGVFEDSHNATAGAAAPGAAAK